MTIQETKWPTESASVCSRTDRILCVALLLSMIPVSFGISYFFDYLYQRPGTDEELMLLNSFIYASGFVILVIPIMCSLRTYNFWSIILLFSECFGLILILVTFKRHLSDQYENIAGNDPTALAAFVSYVSAAAFEESLKLAVFATPLVFFKRFRTVYDAVWFGSLSGVSFATIENLILSNRSVLVALQRFIWCTATHTSDCLVGVLIFLYMKSVDHPLIPDRWYFYPLILIIPVALHGSFDFLIFYGRLAGEDWISRMSLLVGALSLVLCLGMFYPLRRRRFARNPVVEENICVQELPSCSSI